MRYYHFVILSSCWFLLIGVRAQENTLGRNGCKKRIIGGSKLKQSERKEAPFSIIRYYTWIGLAHDRYGQLWRRAVSFLVPYKLYPWTNSKRLKCGGALIHPKIVQTACHCVTRMTWSSEKDLWGRTAIVGDWEERMMIFMGRSKVRSFKYPILTSRFFAHQACQMLSLSPHMVKYDIGWIVLQDEVPTSPGVSEGYWRNIDYAYPYKKTELRELHNRAVGERHVCLVIGHGRTEEPQSSRSRVLKYGWIQLLDYTHCYEFLWKSHDLDYLVPDRFYYKRVVSWVCSTNLHPLHEPPYLSAATGSGDSGGPITCNNNYLFVVSQVLESEGHPRAGFLVISKEAAIVHVTQANTVEYRRNFIMELLHT